MVAGKLISTADEHAHSLPGIIQPAGSIDAWTETEHDLADAQGGRTSLISIRAFRPLVGLVSIFRSP